MTEIYLIRHSQAEGNRYRMIQGSWDGEITEMGRRQIDALAERFAEIPVDAVYSSDLTRAMLTADAAARRDGLPIQTRSALRELNAGPWERCFFGNICHDDPELGFRFIHDAENWQIDGAETYEEVRTRALAELKRIAEENEGKTVAVVSHGITIRCIISGITGIPLTDTERVPIFRNTAVSRLLWDGASFHIDFMNDASHLPNAAQSTWNTAADLRDAPFDPIRDREYYESCYADAWKSVHGNLKHFSPETYFSAARQHQQRFPGSVLRIYHGEETVGLVDMDPERGAEKGIGWISLLYLKEDYRNRGYGIQLLARAIIYYQDHNRRCLRLQVAEKNGIALAFYKREGFDCIGEQRGSDGKLLILEKPLF